jgi:serine/threonine-protein kinase
VFSLAVIAYRCATGQTAFVGDEAEVLRNTRERMPSRPSPLAPIDPSLDAVLAIGLAKRPADRFASAASFVEAFALASRGELSDELAARAAQLGQRWPWSA